MDCFFCKGSPKIPFGPSRRVLLIKEVEILGHITTDWDYLYEDFTRPPSTDENLLQIFVKVRESDLGIISLTKTALNSPELL